VAIAVSLGGPGATFWMILAGLLGMSSKFTECSLAMIYRKKRSDGHIMGGPMEYLYQGLAEQGKPKLGKFLAILFAFLCIGGSFGGGGSFQVNQSLNAISETVPFFADHKWFYGLIMALFVGIVIIGGIKRIAGVAEKVVPAMCGLYILACRYILAMNASLIPTAFSSIISSAFSPEATYGGFIGVLVTGFKRAAFSNEAGVGSAAIAHAAAKSEYNIQEGIVALLEPFIDTVVICTMTDLVIVITGDYNNPEYITLIDSNQGAAVTSRAMGQVIPWFPYVLSVAVVLFAFSPIISWSYYGERCFSYIFGEKYSMGFKILLLIVVFLGAITTSANVLEFGDLMILGMAFPNIFGIYFLVGRVKKELNEYWAKLESGEIKAN
ncbi:MAG: amino acid carrier protein, partial [Bdellovibrionales bacterium]|nr:alanine:cation symporter family protein [Bdellovibrionales bacterium]NQZ19366.1 amino acid carrier protein [Bdellovibrionales bacterium]